MNPRMDEVSEAVRAVFPLINGKNPRYGTGWLLTLGMSAVGSVLVGLKNPAGDRFTFAIGTTEDPAIKVAGAAARFAAKRERVVA